jgi:hypothetical protein
MNPIQQRITFCANTNIYLRIFFFFAYLFCSTILLVIVNRRGIKQNRYHKLEGERETSCRIIRADEDVINVKCKCSATEMITLPYQLSIIKLKGLV